MSKPEFFYLVSGRMFRTIKNETNPIEVYEIFKDENPIIARENAFNYFQSYIDVLLESLGKEYVNHFETEKDLKPFLSSYKRQYVKIGEHVIDDMELDVDCDKGLGISIILSDSKTFLNAVGHTLYEDSQLIHYIDNQFTDLKPYILDALIYEFSLYKKYGYDSKNYRLDYNVSRKLNFPVLKPILKTPIYNH